VAADAVVVALIVIAVIVAEWGGFRTWIGGMRVALTSPYRILAVALAVLVMRHALVRTPPIYVDIPRRIRRGAESVSARTAFAAVVGTRPAILFVGYLAVVMIGYRTEQPPLRFSDNELVNLQVRWDMGWYFGIAVDGYRVLSHDPNAQQNIVFFPAYPMITRGVGRLLGGTPTAYIVAGTLVAVCAFFWALTYVFRLARDLTGEEDSAWFAVWLVACYPFALFFGAFYTESLYLLGVVGAFYHLRRRELWAAGAWGLLVGLTRPNGCFLSLPLAVMALMPWLPSWLGGGAETSPERAPERRSLTALASALAAAAMPGIGVLLYSAYIWHIADNPLAWAAGHAAWGREYRGLTAIVTDRYAWFANEGLYAYTSKVPGDLVNSLGAIFVLVAAIPAARKFGLAYALFILVNILPPMADGGMLSIGRLSSVLFPAFLWFATAIPARHRTGWLVTFMAAQAFNATLFYTWRELF
jgi:hypothetical protein